MREQRRLFYVALTRCTEVLALSSVARLQRRLAHRMGVRLLPGAGEHGVTIASRFLAELGPATPAARPGPQFLAGL